MNKVEKDYFSLSPVWCVCAFVCVCDVYEHFVCVNTCTYVNMHVETEVDAGTTIPSHSSTY